MTKYLKIIKIILFLALIAVTSIAFSYKKEILSTFNVFKFFFDRNLAIKSNDYLIDTTLHDLKLTKISIKNILKNYNYSRVNSPVGFIESYKDRLFFISNIGEFFEIIDFNKKIIKKINTNFNSIANSENFIKTMGVRGIYFDQNDEKIYVSYIYNNNENNCTGIAIIFSNLNNLKDISFSEAFRTKCINYENEVDFNEMSSGGKIISLDTKSLLLTVGDFWQNNISQNINREYGKILKIDKESYISSIYSYGHRNPQGITKINKKIFATEHGPRGGDEINQILKGENYGWPIVAYGPTYKKNYSKYFLKNHKNFKEPFLAFAPSIGISDIEYYDKELFDRWTGDLLVASMKNNTGMTQLLNPGLSLYRIKMSEDNDKIIYQEKIFIGDRIRDIEILDNGLIFIVTEENPSIYKINKIK